MSLTDIAAALAARRLPPVEQWQPAETADSLMRIAADGTWFHEGRPISRPAMVRAFASLLLRGDDGQHWLMTPQCRQTIVVEDAAFIAVDVQRRGNALAFRLNTDDLLLAGPANPLRAAGTADAPALYLAAGRGCEARLNRSTWLQLADLALAEAGADADLAGLAITSMGAVFPLAVQ